MELNKLSRPHPLLEWGPRIKYVLQLIMNKLFSGKFPGSREIDKNFPVSREVKNGQFWETLVHGMYTALFTACYVMRGRYATVTKQSRITLRVVVSSVTMIVCKHNENLRQDNVYWTPCSDVDVLDRQFWWHHLECAYKQSKKLLTNLYECQLRGLECSWAW